MNDYLNNPGEKESYSLLIFSSIAIFLSGLFFAFIYFVMDKLNVALQNVHCAIPGNAYFSTCQGMFGFTIYKVLALKTMLIWGSYLFIFTLIVGLLLMTYKKGKSPATVGIMFLVSIIFTYLAIPISNIYRQIITNPTMYSMVQPFTIYNKIMLNFPWFIGIITVVSLALSLINFQRSKVNTETSDLDY